MTQPNWGLAPIDYESDIGQLRAIIGDVSYEVVAPPPDHADWVGDFQWLSDYVLTVYLDRTDSDVDAAAVLAFRSMADALAAQAADIKTDDLQVSNLWRQAQFFYDRADKAEQNLNADIFELAPLGPDYECTPELAPVWVPDGWRPCWHDIYPLCGCS